MFVVSPHLQARCVMEGGGVRRGGGASLSLLLASCDNEQHPLAGPSTLEGSGPSLGGGVPLRCDHHQS